MEPITLWRRHVFKELVDQYGAMPSKKAALFVALALLVAFFCHLLWVGVLLLMAPKSFSVAAFHSVYIFLLWGCAFLLERVVVSRFSQQDSL